MFKNQLVASSLFVISQAAFAVQFEIYQNSLTEYCKIFSEVMPLSECVSNYETSAIFKGLSVQSEEDAYQKAKKLVFTDGKFKLSPNRQEYRYIEQLISPLANNTYVETRHHVFYLNDEMDYLQHIIMDYRHGNYAGIKEIEHEIVNIIRHNAKLIQSKEPVYWAPSYPKFTLQQFDMTGYKFYRYQLQNLHQYSTHNFSPEMDFAQNSKKWINSKVNKNPLEANKTLQFEEDLLEQIPEEVFLLFKFNSDSTVSVAAPRRNLEGYIIVDEVSTLIFSDDQKDATRYAEANFFKKNKKKAKELKGGWFAHTKGFDPLEPKNANGRKNLAKAKMNGQKRFICRFSYEGKDGAQLIFGFVQGKGNGKFVCSGGGDVRLKNILNQLRRFESPIDEFDWLSLNLKQKRGDTVEAKKGFALCSISDVRFYGVGYVNQKSQCVQDDNVYWSNGKNWKFSQGWTGYLYK